MAHPHAENMRLDKYYARAVFVYEATRIEALVSGRPIVPEPWADREGAFTEQFIETIKRLCDPLAPPTTPEEEHNSWWQAYIDMGWTYGPERDPAKKTHPDMVPFDDLPKAERDKDEIFIAVCELAAKYIQ